MATSKLLKPTNVTISIPEFTDQPDQRVNSNCIDKEADAINALSEHIASLNSNKSSLKIYVASVTYTFSNSDYSQNIDISTLTGGVVTSSNVLTAFGACPGGNISISMNTSKTTIGVHVLGGAFTGSLNGYVVFMYS